MIAIVDYQAGNQTSVWRALKSLGIEAGVTDEPARIKAADGVIFPGVGAAGQAMTLLTRTGLDEAIREVIALGRPFLGICLGCQIMLESSEEDGGTATLGVIPGHCRRFGRELADEAGRPLRVPHMGWNNVRFTRESALFKGARDDDQFYFVHSYYPEPAPETVLGVTGYGLEFASAFGREGLWALQFHPEKSGPAGLRLLRNFHDYCVKEAGPCSPKG